MLEVRVIPAGNTAGNFSACRRGGMGGDGLCAFVPAG